MGDWQGEDRTMGRYNVTITCAYMVEANGYQEASRIGVERLKTDLRDNTAPIEVDVDKENS